MFAAYIQPLVADYGLLAVFFIVMLESAGAPVPGETALVSAAVFAGATGGLRIEAVIGVAILGAILGDNVGFWIGRRFGPPLLKTYGGLIGLGVRRRAIGEHLFRRHGGKIVFYGRFVAFLRMFAALLAGASGLGWKRFLMFNAAGAIVWAAAFGLGGFVFGAAVTRVSGPASMLGLVAAVAGIVVVWRVALRQEDRYFAELERENKP